jgi:hypothetical protein
VITANDLVDFFISGLTGAAVYEFTLFISNDLKSVKVENKPVALKITIPMLDAL